MTKLTPTLLLILDGWGIAPDGQWNAPFVANTPNLDKMNATCPKTQLSASGRSVGLPVGYMGNSEVGHLNIGAGRIVYQDMTRIDIAIENGDLAKNPAFTKLMQETKASGGTLHFAGLLSDGGVHSHINHLEALCKLAAAEKLPIMVHCFMDGRDTPPESGIEYIRTIEKFLNTLDNAKIGSVTGRYYAMDRDKRWDRVNLAWDMLIHCKAERAESAEKAVQDSYKAGITDEFIKPVLVASQGLKNGDGLFLFNFRADRMRQLAHALADADFSGFERGKCPKLHLACMTPYEANLTIPVAFPKEGVEDGLGEILAKAGYKQLRLAETEKYAHVTYFFSGGQEKTFENEDRILIESPRHVPTYDLAPEMSAIKVTDAFVEAWNKDQYDFVVCNLANGDMVGHTGIMEAAVKACTTVDQCVGRMLEAVKAKQGRMLLIADHGNCEKMLGEDGQPFTAHTTNPVPCILFDASGKNFQLKQDPDAKLADVAPTILAMWGLEQPKSMDANSLVAN